MDFLLFCHSQEAWAFSLPHHTCVHLLFPFPATVDTQPMGGVARKLANAIFLKAKETNLSQGWPRTGREPQKFLFLAGLEKGCLFSLEENCLCQVFSCASHQLGMPVNSCTQDPSQDYLKLPYMKLIGNVTSQQISHFEQNINISQQRFTEKLKMLHLIMCTYQGSIFYSFPPGRKNKGNYIKSLGTLFICLFSSHWI